MKKRIIMIVAIAMIVCIAAIACLACGTKEVKANDLGGKTYKFFSVTHHTYFYGYDWLSTYTVGSIKDKDFTFSEDALVVEFNKDGSSGTIHYNYKSIQEEYAFTYTVDEPNNEIEVTIDKLDYSATAKFSQDMLIVDTDGLFGFETCVTYMRLA